MRRKLYSVLAAIGITLAVSFGFSAPALAAYSGSYSGTMAYGNTKFATGDHDSSYSRGTVSVDAGCSKGGIFWFEVVGGGRCTSAVSVSPRITKELYFTSSYSGGTQLWGTADGSAPYSIWGTWRFNVR